ncbi:MAG: fatty acid desaturase, partial [Bdellovibrionota bacterium]
MPKETRYALAVIIAAYAITTALALLAHGSWLLWLLSLPVIAGLQGHLLLLHHEGAHGLLHPKRAANDFITNLFCGYPFFELLRPYREFHFAHHRHATDETMDPEIPFYNQQGIFFTSLSRKRKLLHIVLDLSGYHWLQFFFSFLFSLKSDNRLFSRHDH